MATGGRSLGIFYSGEEAGANRVGGRKMSTKAILISQLQSQFPRARLGYKSNNPRRRRREGVTCPSDNFKQGVAPILRFVDAVGGKEEGEGRKGEDSMIT